MLSDRVTVDVIIARYRATCPLCHRGILPGMDAITREPDGARRWVHAQCLESVSVDVDALISDLLAGT